MSDIVLVLHGWGGNKPEHWQEHLVRSLAKTHVEVRYPRFDNPMAPDQEVWLAQLKSEILSIPNDAELTVLAHSLGCINWMHYAASLESGTQFVQAGRVLLVAPPYVIREIPPLDAPPGAAAFFPPPLSKSGIEKAARETVLVASDTDDYSTFDQSAAIADGLGIPVHRLAGAGHISPYYGYGEWPWVQDWTLRHCDLPPQTNM